MYAPMQTPISMRAPTETPTPMPAFAPVLRPEESCVWEAVLEVVVDAAAEVDEAVAVAIGQVGSVDARRTMGPQA